MSTSSKYTIHELSMMQDVVYRMAIQARYARIRGEIDAKLELALINVCSRVSTSYLIEIDEGPLYRKRPAKWWKFWSRIDDDTQFVLACIASFGIAMFLAWLTTHYWS